MPIYMYQCDNCGVRFERQQSFSDPVIKQCPECLEETVRKVYTPVGIVFKGSGFYSTDNRSPSGNRPSKDKDSSENKTGETTEKTDKSEKTEKPDKVNRAKEN